MVNVSSKSVKYWVRNGTANVDVFSFLALIQLIIKQRYRIRNLTVRSSFKLRQVAILEREFLFFSIR
jgi:hypothetical protein